MVTLARQLADEEVPARNFEALFLGLGGIDDDLRHQLSTVGYDEESGRASYPEPVWRESWEVVFQRRFGHLSPSQGRRRMAEVFVEGFLKTTVGATLAQSIASMPAERVMSQVARWVALWQPAMTISVQPLGERHWRLDATYPGLDPDNCVGGLIALLRLTGVVPKVEVLSADATTVSLSASW